MVLSLLVSGTLFPSTNLSMSEDVSIPEPEPRELIMVAPVFVGVDDVDETPDVAIGNHLKNNFAIRLAAILE